MRGECIQAVSEALGRPITQAEANKIEQKISENKRLLAAKDRQAYLAMPESLRLAEAAKMAAASIKSDAAKKQQQIALTVQAHDRIKTYLENQPGLMIDNITRLVAPKLDYKDNTLSAETRAKAIYYEYTSQLSDDIESFGPKMLGIIQNDAAMVPVFKELRGTDSGIPEAKQFADKLSSLFESIRQRFNNAGGNIGRLEDWAHPQAHSSYLIFKAGLDNWKSFILPLLDRSRYVNEDGSRMTDEQMSEFLDKAFRSIVYDGKANDAPVTQGGGGGMRANRGSEHRQLHFKDGDSYLVYHSQFAEKSLMHTIIGHISQASKDIAMVETFSPNSDLMFKHWLKEAYKQGADKGIAKDKLDRREQAAINLYDEVAGRQLPVANMTFARTMSTIREVLNMRLGSAVFSALSDDATAIRTAHVMNMSGWEYMHKQMEFLTDAQKRKQARSLGLGLDTMLFAINRFGQEELARGLASRVSGAVIRSSSLSFMTEARRQGFGAMMMHQIGDLVAHNQSLSDLHPGDNKVLLSKGIAQQDWEIWRMAQQEDFGGEKLLTPRSILAIEGIEAKAKQDAADRLMGAILEETGVAIIQPGARERAMTTGKIQRGTLLGELGLSMLQFKSFPIAMMTRHWRRALSEDSLQGKAGYLAALIAGTTLAGAVGVQLNEVASGRDPLDISSLTFWGRAFLKGGAFGFYGDFLMAKTNPYGGSLFGALEGPSLGFIEEFLNLTQGNAAEYIQGNDLDELHFGAEAIKLIKGIVPGTSLWYTKAALDHMIFQNLQEMASPGYLRRMTQRAQREFKQQYYWKPGDALPSRGPDLGRMTRD